VPSSPMTHCSPVLVYLSDDSGLGLSNEPLKTYCMAFIASGLHFRHLLHM
jgi:hypothetical protein